MPLTMLRESFGSHDLPFEAAYQVMCLGFGSTLKKGKSGATQGFWEQL